MAAVPKIVVARSTFHGPDRLAVTEGTLWDAAHPVVKAHPDRFQPAEAVAIMAPSRKPTGD